MLDDKSKVELDVATTLLQVNLFTLQEHPNLIEKTMDLLNSRIDFGRFQAHKGYRPREIDIEGAMTDNHLMIGVRDPDDEPYAFSEQMLPLVSVTEFLTDPVWLQKDEIFPDGRKIVEYEYIASVRHEVLLLGEASDSDATDLKYMQCVRVDYVIKE